jgi:putative ATP-grasp target RiPP
MQATSPDDQIAPWGVRRMKPFPPADVLPAARAVLDAATQTAAWTVPDGSLLPALDKHKRSQTSRETTTKTSMDGNSDEGSDQQGDSD